MAIKTDSLGGFRYNYDLYKAEYIEWNHELVFYIQDYTTFLPGITRIHSGIYPFKDAIDKLDIPSSIFESPELELWEFKLYDVFVDRHGELIFEFISQLNDPFITLEPFNVYIKLK